MAAAIMMLYADSIIYDDISRKTNPAKLNLPDATTGQTNTEIDVDKILGRGPVHVNGGQQLREQFPKNNRCCRKLMSIPTIYKFILICTVLLLLAIPIILLLGRGNGFDVRYHKYKDLPSTTCLGGSNITDVWFSPPYPFNTTATHAPAWATYRTLAFVGNNKSLVHVLGRIPNKLEELGLIDMPCGYCSNRANYVCSSRSCSCRCRYMLGELEIAIQDLYSKPNYTCVVDTANNEIISLVPSSAMLNRMYRDQITGFILLGVCAAYIIGILGWVAYQFITLFVLWSPKKSNWGNIN